MNFKSLALAAVLLPAAFGAYADNYTAPTQVLEGGPTEWSIGFETTHSAGAFTDTFTFTYSGIAGDAVGFFKNLQNTKSNIDFSSATLNGVSLDIYNIGSRSGSDFELPVSGLLTLVINGTAFGGTSSYSGTLDVITSVPEPTTYGMLIGGLGVMAFLARRRKQQ